MRRTSPDAKKLSHALQQLGLNVSPRRLERWGRDRLEASRELPFDEQVAHYAALAAISSSGRDSDVTARRLASRGFPCARLRSAILGEFGIASVPPAQSIPDPDLSTGPAGDAAFAELEAIASWMTANTDGLPPLMGKVVQVLRRNAARHAEKLGEPAEHIFYSFVVSTLCHLMGDGHYNGKAAAAVMDLDPDEVGPELLEFVNTHLRFSIRNLEDAYRQAPIDAIVAMAQLLAEGAPALLEYLDVPAGQGAEIEDLATIFAPLALYVASLLRGAFSDFPQEIPALPAPPTKPELSAAS